MTPPQIVVLGLSLSSSWGNGHATTYRSLIRGLHTLGAQVHFLERDVPWYRSNRDLAPHPWCSLSFYDSRDELEYRYSDLLRRADAVIIGSYVREGVTVIDLVRCLNPRVLCFYDIDTPVTLAKLDRGDEEYIARRQIPAFDIYFSFSGGDVLRRLEQQYGARRARPLYCSVDETAYRHTGEAPRWDLGYLGTYSADRQPALERLLLEPARRLPHRRFVVAGSMYPDTLSWPGNVDRIEHVAAADHPSFYSRQRFALNITRSDMIAAGWSPSVRLFEAAAVGTPIIGDHWRGLGEFLPEGDAILIARDTDDVIDILEHLPQTERRRIADAARARTLAGHTGKVRAGQLIADLQSLAAASQPESLETV